jgi:peptidoglycan-associated lipoprotein
MQKGSSQITAGDIAPSISGPKKDREVLVVSGLVVSLAAVIGAVWYSSSIEQTAHQDQLSGSQVSEALKTSQPIITPASLTATKGEDTRVATARPDVLHIDLYFEVGRKGLTDEGRTVLQEQASLMKKDANLGVLIQGYTDQQGSAGYNKTLGLKRAETVKTELINAGVPEHRIKTVTLGKEGALCIDRSDVCRQMNRRVHLEIRPIGDEHMRAPVVATTPAPETIQAEPIQGAGTPGSLVEGLVPSADASEGDNGPIAVEPPSGS